MTKERATVPERVAAFRPETTFHRKVTLSFVIPSEAEGSAVPRIFRGNAEFYPQNKIVISAVLFSI
jgi:hypothetical protein